MTSNDNSKKKQRKGSNTSPMSYNDYSTANPESYMFAASNSGKKGGVKIPFPVKLFQMLEQIDIHNPELAPIVSWQPHGRSFRVHDLEKFKERILPEFFNDSQYTSFTRQLNLWRFKRMKGSGLDRSSYYHPMFLRDRPFLCNGMNRTALVGSGKKKKRGVSSCLSDRSKNYEQPKFYSMEPMPPTTKKQINASKPAIEMNAFGLNSMPSCDSVSNDRRTSSFQSLEIPFYHVHHFPPSDTSMQKQDNSMYSRYCIDSKPSGISMDSQKDDSFQNQDYRSMYKRGNSYEESMYDHSWSPITGVPPPLTKEEIRQIRDMCSRIK